MKRTWIRCAVSVLLALALCFSALTPAFAAQASENDPPAAACENVPVVVVRGMAFNGLHQAMGTPEERPAFQFEVGPLLKAIGRVVWKGVTRMSGRAALEEVADYAYDLMKALTVEEDGTSPYGTGMPDYPEAAGNYPELCEGVPDELGLTHSCIDAFGGDHVFYVNYDWRIDPFIIADQIHAAVERAVSETGHDKVNLVCCSMGGIMTIAYLTKYGYERMNKVLFMSSTFCGAQVASDCLTGRLEIDAQVLYDFFDTMTVDSKAGNLAIKALKFLGVFRFLEKLGTKILEKDIDLIYDRVLTPIFGHMLPLWGLCMPEDYEAGLDYMFGGEVGDDFRAKADALQEMMAGRDALLNEMIASGREIAVVSGYNQPLNPVYESAGWSGDRILESYQTSGFATVARYGETLSDDYIANAADPALISPDHCVDLSTAHFRDYTYMVRNGPHVACSYGTEYAAFLIWMLSTDTSIKPGTDPRYPHFLESNNAMELHPLK
ncbi:MAG: hypothetical protein IKD72_00350 [Clostridia bacterium]|nr:hypothetical protein [Clostridia bacterium]